MTKLKIILFCLLSTLNSANSEEIKVITEHFPPYQIAEEGKPVRGISVELIEELLNEVNVDTDISVYPWARAYTMALTYPNVLIFSIARTPQREQLFHWVGALDTLCNHLWALKKNHSIKINSLEEAKQYLVGVPRDDNVHHYLKNQGFKEQKNLYLVNTREQAVKMLLSNRVDLLMGSELLIEQRVNSLGFNFNDLQKVYSIPSISKNRLSVAFSRLTHLSVVDKYRKAFRKLNADPANKSISNGLNCGDSGIE